MTIGPVAGVGQSAQPRDDRGRGLELLSEEEAWRLLAAGSVGRIGVSIGALPAIFPVNYCVMDGAIVIPYLTGFEAVRRGRRRRGRLRGRRLRLRERSGWSVMAVGPSQVVHDLTMTFQVLAAGPEPLADGHRVAIVRIDPAFVSGRRIVHEPFAELGDC